MTPMIPILETEHRRFVDEKFINKLYGVLVILTKIKEIPAIQMMSKTERTKCLRQFSWWVLSANADLALLHWNAQDRNTKESAKVSKRETK